MSCYQQLIEVERLIREGNDIIRTMQERGVELKNEQLPISAIVRCPLLAIRWQRPDKKVKPPAFAARKTNPQQRSVVCSSSSNPAETLKLPTIISTSSLCA